MKTRLTLWLLAAMLTASAGVWAEETITVSAQSEDISQNLDLKAVATVFGQSADLEQFERSLNDYDSRINNLDLNGDGQVDYLRVIETGEGDKRLVVIQAVLAQDIYQDVASIMVEKDQAGQTVVQIVGDEYIYGTNYIIEPVYLHVPVIYDYFWRPYYSYWVSPYYWGFWPTYWAPYTCWAVADYWWHINAFHRHHHFCSYRYAPHRRHGFEDLNRHVARNDLATRQPERAFNQRNQGMQNSRDIVPSRTITNRTLASGGQTTGTHQQTAGRTVRSQADFNASRGNSTATRYNTGSRTTVAATGTRSGAATSGSRSTSTSYTTGSRSGAATSGSRGTSTSYTTSGSRSSSSSYSAGTRTSTSTATSSYGSGTRGTSSSYNSGSRSGSYSSGTRGSSSSFSGAGYSSGSRSSAGASYSGGASRSSSSSGYSGGGYSGGGRSSGGGGFSGGGGHSGGGSHGGGGSGRR